MVDNFKQCLWANFGAAIDMLKNAIALCPDKLWEKEILLPGLPYYHLSGLLPLRPSD